MGPAVFSIYPTFRALPQAITRLPAAFRPATAARSCAWRSALNWPSARGRSAPSGVAPSPRLLCMWNTGNGQTVAKDSSTVTTHCCRHLSGAGWHYNRCRPKWRGHIQQSFPAAFRNLHAYRDGWDIGRGGIRPALTLRLAQPAICHSDLPRYSQSRSGCRRVGILDAAVGQRHAIAGGGAGPQQQHGILF